MTYKIQKYRVELVRDGVQRLVYDKAPSAETARYVFHQLLARVPHEELWALNLDAKLAIISAVRISQGGLWATSSRPVDIFRPVIAAGASCFVLGHNHPSGDPEPSESDLEMTRRTIECGELLGVHLIDHVIVTRGGNWRSLRDSLVFGSNS